MVIAQAVAVPADKVMVFDVTAVRPAGVKSRVKAPAVPVITRLVNVATPADAATVVVPLNDPVPVAIDATTLPV